MFHFPFPYLSSSNCVGLCNIFTIFQPYNLQKCTLSYLQTIVSDLDDKKPKILLLHGAAFEAKTWDTTGTLAKLRDWGYKAVAMDLKPDEEVKKCKFLQSEYAVLFLK